MAQRRTLGEISGNRPVGHQLTVNDRAQIVGAIKCGVSLGEVSRTLNFAPLTVTTTAQRDSIRQGNKALPRSGQPKKTTNRDVYMII